jgi:hypothetical protein
VSGTSSTTPTASFTGSTVSGSGSRLKSLQSLGIPTPSPAAAGSGQAADTALQTRDQAIPVYAFLDSEGVDASFGGPGKDDPNAELQALNYLGIWHVRQGINDAVYSDDIMLAQNGIKFDTGLTDVNQDVASTIGPSLANIDKLAQAVPGESIRSRARTRRIRRATASLTAGNRSLILHSPVPRNRRYGTPCRRIRT